MKALIIGGAILLVIIAFLPAYYFYSKYQAAQKQLQNNPFIMQDDPKILTEKVGKLIEVPTDETPSVATVTDLEKLKDQVFFAKAKKGDKLLLYNNAKKAILYDPIANKIIEVGPLIVPSPQLLITASPSAEVINPTEAKTINVVLFNGTTIAGLTKKIETLLKEEFPNIKIVDKDVANKKDYDKTLVIDLAPNSKEEVETIAKAINAETSSLPAGETKPKNADILIIVGKDKK